MAADEQEKGTSKANEQDVEAEPHETRQGTERLLREQALVNEREHEPQRFGGMAKPPVEKQEPPARPEQGKETPVDEIEPRPGKTDIQSEGE